MPHRHATAIPQGPALRVTKTFQYLLRVALALLPIVAILYLQVFLDPQLRFKSHGLHELAITVSTLLSGFVTYVTWLCYRSSGEVFLRWLVLGLLGFTLLYAPHGLFTRLGDGHLELFVVFGPVSRFAMVACFLVAVLRLGAPADEPGQRHVPAFWLAGVGLFVVAGVAAGAAALLLPQETHRVRPVIEALALATSLLAIVALNFRRSRSPLMLAYLFSLALFAQSSLSFLLASAWNHQWWLGHGIFAAGFFVLSYSIVQAFHTTRSFSAAYSQEDLFERLRQEKSRADNALVELEVVNQRLQQQATTDSLTGAANHRQFADRAAVEAARARRTSAPLALLAVDLDHFKGVNDRHGHQVGDEVLKAFVEAVRQGLRVSDLIARTGGEEFKILLPDTALAGAVVIAERIRGRVAALAVVTEHSTVKVTVSIGCAAFDGDLESTERVADECLYRAKALGRNRVVSAGAVQAPGEPDAGD